MACVEELLEWFGEFLEEVASWLVCHFDGIWGGCFGEWEGVCVAEDYQDLFRRHFVVRLLVECL